MVKHSSKILASEGKANTTIIMSSITLAPEFDPKS